MIRNYACVCEKEKELRTKLRLTIFFSSSLQRTVAGYPPPQLPSSWPLKPDPGLDAAAAAARRLEAEERERERQERQRREEERQRREREERERREKEEKARKEQREREERERERERERREKERRERERLEIEQRERMLQQQRMNENSKMVASVGRDRSPLRNGTEIDPSRIKEEPKRDEDLMIRSASVVDPRYHNPSAMASQVQQAHAAQAAAAALNAQHHYMSRHGPHMLGPPPPHLARTILTHSMGGPPMSHYAPPSGGGWPSALDPYGRDPYRLDPMHQLRYNPIMEAAIRADQEERAKAMSLYAAHSAAHLRAKDPSPVPPQHRMNQSSMKPSPSHMAVGPNGHPVSVDMHKKEDSQSGR